MRKLRAVAACHLVLIAAILGCASWTDVYVPSSVLYVTTGGNDSNDCRTLGTACLTITAAVTKATDGELIVIGPGHFHESLTVTDKSLVIEGWPISATDYTLIDGGGGFSAARVSGASSVVIENVVLMGGGTSASLGGAGAGLDVYVTAPHFVVLRNSMLLNNENAEVYVWQGLVVLDSDYLTTLDPASTTADALTNIRGNVTLQNSRVWDNPGVGVRNTGVMTIRNTTISGNMNTGVANSLGGTMTIDSSTISGTRRTAAPAGYGIYSAGDLSITNSTVSGNTGAGIQFTNSSLSLSYVTDAGNGGNGLYGGSAAPVALNITNSLIENNTGQDCVYDAGAVIGGFITFSHSLHSLSDGSCDGVYEGLVPHPLPPDTHLGPLADNGGPTKTMALLPGSAALDAATDSCPAADQRGIARPQPAGGLCDIGAFELNATSPSTAPTPTAALPTSTPAALLLTWNKNANCRIGPSTGYNVVTAMPQGTALNATGRDPNSSWWQVQLPGNGALCWVADSAVDKSAPGEGVPTANPPPLPEAPGQFVIGNRLCTQNIYGLTLSWTAAPNATGYRVYRGGQLMATLKPGTTKYSDQPPRGHTYVYELEAFNDNGVAARLTLKEEACK